MESMESKYSKLDNVLKRINQEGKGTIVVVNISFTTDVDFETIVKMGFEAGFTAGLNNLEEMISNKLLS